MKVLLDTYAMYGHGFLVGHNMADIAEGQTTRGKHRKHQNENDYNNEEK